MAVDAPVLERVANIVAYLRSGTAAKVGTAFAPFEPSAIDPSAKGMLSRCRSTISSPALLPRQGSSC